MSTGDTTSTTGVAGWRSDVYGILPHQADARIWLVPDEDGWSLPHARVQEEDGIWPGSLGRVSELMRQVLQVDVLAYRYAAYRFDEEGRSTSGVYVLERRGTSMDEPATGQWFDRQTLAGLTIHPAEHRTLIEDYFDEVEQGNRPSRRPAWAYPGWFDQAESWILTELASLGYTPSPPVEQVRCWSLSCVLRARTTTGAVYFKTAADLPLFADEPLLLEQLGAWYPDHIPQPLCIERQRRWMLLADWGESIGWEAPEAVREAMYRTLARLQVASSTQVDQLLAVGCVDRRLDVLAAQIDPLLDDHRALALLGEAEQAQLRALAPRLKAMCAELASYNLPYALVHGDLHPGNVAMRDGTMLLFDWTDASVSHPFFDLMHLFHSEPDVQARLRDSYFEAWTTFEPIERLRAAWTVAAPLCALHHTVSYQHIVAGLESVTRPELASGLTFFGRKVLELMPE